MIVKNIFGDYVEMNESVPRKYMMMLNRNGWSGKGEISKTALYLCELHYVTKEGGGT